MKHARTIHKAVETLLLLAIKLYAGWRERQPEADPAFQALHVR